MALWRLPRPDFHRLVDTDFQDTPLTLRPARSPSRQTTLYPEGSDSFVASAAASIATGWSEPVPGRELHPLKSSALSRRTFSPTIGERSFFRFPGPPALAFVGPSRTVVQIVVVPAGSMPRTGARLAMPTHRTPNRIIARFANYQLTILSIPTAATIRSAVLIGTPYRPDQCSSTKEMVANCGNYLPILRRSDCIYWICSAKSSRKPLRNTQLVFTATNSWCGSWRLGFLFAHHRPRTRSFSCLSRSPIASVQPHVTRRRSNYSAARATVAEPAAIAP